MSYENIPLELRTFRSWVVWRYEEVANGKPTKILYCVATGRPAASNDPQTWCSFDEAHYAITRNDWYDGIGFVLSDADPYTFIDLDDPYEKKASGEFKHPNPDEVMQRQLKLFNETKSYAERSPSGTGLHIICKGRVPSGRRRSAIEVYSNLRFMTVTGDVYRDAPIYDENNLVNVLYEQMGEGRNAVAFYAGLEQAKLTDAEVIELAQNAANGEKFYDLFVTGNWQKYYESQSEADFALFDIIAFYSQNGAQTQRIFLNSQIGQREKSRAQDRKSVV